MALAPYFIVVKLGHDPILVKTRSCGARLRLAGLFYTMWLFRPPNGFLLTQRGEFWISAARELSGVRELSAARELSGGEQSGWFHSTDPGIAAFTLAPSIEIKIEKIHRHCSQFEKNIQPPFEKSTLNSPYYCFEADCGAYEHAIFLSKNALHALLWKWPEIHHVFLLKCLLKQASSDTNGVFMPKAFIHCAKSPHLGWPSSWCPYS